MTFADLRDNAQGPHLFTDRVADGVLKDVGLAAQEMPTSFEHGSLTGYLHTVSAETHESLIRPEYRELPAVFKGEDLEALQEALLVDGAMPLASLSTDYASGTALSLQCVGFAPIMEQAGEVPTNYDYTTAMTGLLAEWSGRAPFVNCGDHNNSQFPTGTFHFNNAYPLRCRESDNPYRLQTLATELQINPTGWLINNSQICADTFPGGQSTRTWIKTVFDPSHPTAVGLILEHCTELAAEFGPQLRYMAHGESAISMAQDGASQISTNVAPHMITGFRAWLQHANGLGLTIDEANARWGTAYVSFAAVDVSTDLFWTSANAVTDFRAFSSFLMQELGWQEARACKAADTSALATRFSFGTKGMENANALGDFAAVGDWQGEAEAAYRDAREYLLRPIVDASTLQGVPGYLPITSPTFTIAASFTGQESLAPILRALRNYTTNQVNWLYRDALRAGGVGIGYLFGTPNFSFGAHAASKAAVLGAIGDLVDLHPTHFAGCGAHARVVLHVDPDDASNWRVPETTGGARAAHWIHRALRDRTIGCHVMHDASLMDRPHVRAVLGRCVTVVPFHPDHATLVESYGEIHGASSTGAMILVLRAEQTLPSYANPTAARSNAMGALYNCEPDSVGGPSNCWLYTVRPSRECETEDRYQSKVATFLATDIIPFVAAECANSWDVPLTTAPVTVTTASTSVTTNYVTDGINWTVAVSNMATSGNASVTLAVNSAIATALDVTYTPANLTLTPGETQFVALDATLTGIDAVDVQAAITDARSKLAALAVGYADSVAQVDAILDQADAVVVAHPARAAALYTSAVRAPLVSVSVAAGEATVTVQRLNVEGEATAPIEGAHVLALWPLNLREHGPSELTNGSGVATLTLGAPAALHWDFATQAFVAPWADADELVELHVTDPSTCASTRVTFTP